jgi:peptide/nickel transport system substrate-binding protein
VGTNVPGYETSWNCYDRLISHAKKTLPDGSQSYDRDRFAPELAEQWDVSEMVVTFKLRRDAVVHDGTLVTAKDVNGRSTGIRVVDFPGFQMKAGSLEKPEQLVVVDDHAFRVDFIRKDRLTLPDLGVIVPCVMNSPRPRWLATAWIWEAFSPLDDLLSSMRLREDRRASVFDLDVCGQGFFQMERF